MGYSLPNLDISKQLPHLREVIAKHELGAKRSLGQHYLLDSNLTRRIVREVGDTKNKILFEVGPGPGGLTRALLETDAKQVFAIERDSRCIAALSDLTKCYSNRLTVIEADALNFKVKEIAKNTKITIVANLPYNISIPLLLGWLRQINLIGSMTLMFQKEVAERLIAKPGSKNYGRISVICQWLCYVEKKLSIPPTAFVPPPKVNSALVNFIPRSLPISTISFEIMEKVTAAAFGQRRKMLKSSLGSLFSDPLKILKFLNINPAARAETLKVNEFCRISEHCIDLNKSKNQ